MTLWALWLLRLPKLVWLFWSGFLADLIGLCLKREGFHRFADRQMDKLGAEMDR